MQCGRHENLQSSVICFVVILGLMVGRAWKGSAILESFASVALANLMVGRDAEGTQGELERTAQSHEGPHKGISPQSLALVHSTMVTNHLALREH